MANQLEEIAAERSRQVGLGYDAVHDDSHSEEHFITWAIDYAYRGEAVKASALLIALSEFRVRRLVERVGG